MRDMSHDKINLSRDRIVDLPGDSTCRTTSFECLQHIHLSKRQGTTCPSMMSKSSSLSYFDTGTFQYIYSEAVL